MWFSEPRLSSLSTVMIFWFFVSVMDLLISKMSLSSIVAPTLRASLRDFLPFVTRSS